jgi:aminopeptidase S
VVSGTTVTTVLQQLGAPTNRGAAWAQASVPLSAYAGQSVQIRVAVADASTASLVEGAVDDVRIAQS